MDPPLQRLPLQRWPKTMRTSSDGAAVKSGRLFTNYGDGVTAHLRRASTRFMPCL